MKDSPEFEFYTRSNGHNEFLEFLGTLPLKDQEKLIKRIEVVQQEGLITALKKEWVKKLNDEIYEIRSRVSSNIQRALYFHVSGNRYVITHGFTKKTQKTPPREIKHAEILKKEFEENQNVNS